MSRRTHSMVVFSKLSKFFLKILVCCALPSRNLFNDMMHAKWMCHSLTQGIRTIKTFIKYKNHRKTQGSSAKCWVHCDKIKTVKSKVKFC